MAVWWRIISKDAKHQGCSNVKGNGSLSGKVEDVFFCSFVPVSSSWLFKVTSVDVFFTLQGLNIINDTVTL